MFILDVRRLLLLLEWSYLWVEKLVDLIWAEKVVFIYLFHADVTYFKLVYTPNRILVSSKEGLRLVFEIVIRQNYALECLTCRLACKTNSKNDRHNGYKEWVLICYKMMWWNAICGKCIILCAGQVYITIHYVIL